MVYLSASLTYLSHSSTYLLILLTVAHQSPYLLIHHIYLSIQSTIYLYSYRIYMSAYSSIRPNFTYMYACLFYASIFLQNNESAEKTLSFIEAGWRRRSSLTSTIHVPISDVFKQDLQSLCVASIEKQRHFKRGDPPKLKLFQFVLVIGETSQA